jgi:uncharacterized membrane protein
MTKKRVLKIPSTSRILAFSDGVLAIVVTLLIFEVRVPELADLSTSSVLSGLTQIAPKFISFAISFFTVGIFWVNHHHFFHEITHSDWKLMWYNNLLLFWLTVVPFTTAFIGDYPTQPLVVSLYAFVMFMSALSFTLMGRYVFFQSDLLPEQVPLTIRRSEFRRSLLGVFLYGLATLCALYFVYLALFILFFIPVMFIVPNLLLQQEPTL